MKDLNLSPILFLNSFGKLLYYNTQMEEVISVYKPVGMTPFQLIQELRKTDPKYKDAKIGFAGRLDPLAHGVMLLTLGEGNKNRNKYLELNKSYDFTVLFGIETDSYDYLGFLISTNVLSVPENLNQKITTFLKKNTGKFTQSYPPFSSKPVNGIPLYKLAKSGKLGQTNIPTKDVEIFNLKLKAVETKSTSDLKKEIITNLKKIKGHFRQTKTIQKWQELFKKHPDHSFTLAHFSIDCSSGTYVRSIAQKLGKKLQCNAIAYEIYRTKVGDFTIEKSLNLKELT